MTKDQILLSKADEAIKYKNWKTALDFLKKAIQEKPEQPDETFAKLSLAYSCLPRKNFLDLNKADATMYKIKAERLDNYNKEAIGRTLDFLSTMVQDFYVKQRRGFPEFVLDKRSQELPQRLLEGSSLISSRELMLEYLPKNARAMEVGTRTGEFAKLMLEKTNPKELHVVDISFRLFVEKWFTGYDNLVRHECFSTEAMDKFEDGYFDWIYVDCDNAYKSGVRDLTKSYQKLRSGGLLILNGYNMWSPSEIKSFGYMRATNEIILKYQLKVKYLTIDTSGYHDIVMIKS